MCELMSIAATAVFVWISFRAKRAGRPAGAAGATALAFLGASLMWSVDCVQSLLADEGLLDLSVADAALGFVVVFAGVALFSVLRLREAHRASRAAVS